jgi:hypothetical protein
LVVLTNSVVADAREVHWSRERRSESLPYCAANAHALKSLPCGDRSVKNNHAHVICKRSSDRCQFDVSILRNTRYPIDTFSQIVMQPVDHSYSPVLQTEVGFDHNSLCAHTQVIDRYSPRPIFALTYDDTAAERSQRRWPNGD